MIWLTALEKIAVAGSAITVAIISIKGLRTWRKQIIGGSQHEAAKNIIRSALKTKRAIEQTRAIGRYSFEEEGLSEEQKSASNSETRAHRYSMRLKILLADNASEFELASFEAEALWGKKAKDKTDLLKKCIGEIYHASNASFMYKRMVEVDQLTGKQTFDEIRNSLTQYRKILYYPETPDELDEFGNKVNSAVETISDYFRRYLK